MQLKQLALIFLIALPTTAMPKPPGMLESMGKVCLTPLQVMTNPRTAYSERPIAAALSTAGHGVVLVGFYWTMLKLLRESNGWLSGWSNGDIRGVMDAMHFHPEGYYKTLKACFKGGISTAVLARFLVRFVPTVTIKSDVNADQAVDNLVNLFSEVAKAAPFLFYLYLTHKGFAGGAREGLQAMSR